MFGGLDPKKMQAVMKQMGIAQEEIPAIKVTIEKKDGTKIIIEEPNVVKIKMQGQESFQITGQAKEIEEAFTEEDIETVAEKTKSSKTEAKKALERTNGDLAEAILELS